MSLSQLLLVYGMICMVVAYSVGRYNIRDPRDPHTAVAILRLTYAWPLYLTVVLLMIPAGALALLGKRTLEAK